MNFCENCGYRLSTDDKFCQNCGKAVSPGQHIQDIPSPPKQEPQPPAERTYQKPVHSAGAGKKKSPLKIILIILGIFFVISVIAGAFIAGYFLFIDKSGSVFEKTREEIGNTENQKPKKETIPLTTENIKKPEQTKKEGFQKREKRNGDCGDYPELSERKLSPEELIGVSEKEKRYMRNEIYMRHGYIFRDEDLLLHFAMFECYKPEHINVNKYLTEIEMHNINMLK